MKNQEEMNQNEILVLQNIYKTPGLSRVDLSKKLKINKASMSEFINSLLKRNIIKEVGAGESTSKGGRKPIQLEINYDYGLCLGIDIAKNYISYILTNLHLDILAYDTLKVSISKENALDLILDIIGKNEDIYSKYEKGLLGMTIAIHGIANEEEIRFTPNYDIDELDLVGQLRAVYPDIEYNLINESNASALCELIKNDSSKNIVCVNIGFGVGAGVIINGKLVTGVKGYAGEIGHMIVVLDGKQCKCGNRGCVEQYCSEIATLSFYNSISEKKLDSLMDVINLYKEGDKNAILTIEEDVKYMGLLVNNIMKSIAPRKIIINSDLSYYIPDYIDLVKDQIKNPHNQDIDIQASIFHKRSVLLGSVFNSILDFLNLDYLA